MSGHQPRTSLRWRGETSAPIVCQVDVSEEEEEFQGVVTACLNVLLLGIETRLDVGLQAMVRVNWSAVEAVSTGCVLSRCSADPLR